MIRLFRQYPMYPCLEYITPSLTEALRDCSPVFCTGPCLRKRHERKQ